ncbi:restriction endonuclease subunit S [Postechiella marina]|uniref:Restriction endonuclease subunit S n=1 Tax=Postechiella marina TaxID=943941 RepID=A0ABP8CCB7_9FLAO
MANENNNLNVIASEERAKQSAASQPSLRVDVARNEAKAISSKQRKSLIPKLRFKEFEGEWEQKRVNSFSSKLKVGFVGTCEPYYTSETEGVLLIRTGNLKGVNIELDEEKYVTKEFHNKNKKSQIQPDDLLLARHGGNGEICRVPKEFPTANCLNIVILRTNTEVDSVFFQLVYSTYFVQKQIKAVTAGSTQVVINTKEIGKLKVSFPKLPEQQKIANFLTAVDTKLQQLTTKKETLEQYKKGVMQQLFSQQLRFKADDGSTFPDWEFPHANVLFKSVSDKKHNSDLPILAITQDQGAIPRDMINYQMIVTDKSVASYKVVQVGDFIISLRSFQGGIEYSNYHGICSPAYNILRPTSENVNNDFYRIYLKTEFYIKQLQKRLEGIRDGKMISYKYFSEIKLPFPSLKEQQKIATYLSAIDKKIEAVQTQISNTQAFKKGLLQQMFV